MTPKPQPPSHSANPKPATFDIVIIGAGMVGGALACDLARQGARVALIEKRLPQPFVPSSKPDIRVSSINIASEKYLTDLGAWPHILAMRSQPYQRLAVWESLPSVISQWLPLSARKTEFNAAAMGHSHLGNIIENQVIQLALHEVWSQQKNITCFAGCVLQELSTNEQAATLLLSNGQQLRSQLVVGADGAQSKVRQLAKLGINSDAYAQQAMVLSVATHGAPVDITWQAFTAHGPLAYLPLPAVGGVTYASLVWYDLPTRHQLLMRLPTEELIEAIHQEFPKELPRITDVLAKATFPLVKRHAQHYSQHRVVLVGDAAHTINPLAGQGVNLGLQDARILAEHLTPAIANGTDLGAVSHLTAYEKVRRPANLLMMSAMDGIYYTFSNNLAPLKLARNLGLGLANHLTPAKKQVMAYALGLNE